MRQNFHKYLAIFKLFMIRALQFRSEMLIWLVIEASPFLVMFAVWQSIFSGHDQLKGFNLPQILQYYFLIYVISAMVETHFESLRCQEVRLGKIDFKMIRPFSYLKEILCHDLSSKFIYCLMGLPIFILMWLILSPVLNHQLMAGPSLQQWLWFLFLLVVGYTINFLVAFWIVLGSFWMEGSQGLEHFKWILINLFSGMIPLTFLPSWMQTIAQILPFKYLYAVPIGLMQGTQQINQTEIVGLVATIAVMLIITQLGWKKAVMKYSSSGG